VQTGKPADEFNWLLNNFAERVAGVVHTVVVSSDGLLVASSAHLPRDNADSFAAVISSLISVVKSAARLFDGDEVRQTVVEMGRGCLLAMSIRDGSCLASLISRDAEIGVVGYEMAKLAKQAGEVLTPALRAELQSTLPQALQTAA
jgi:predicted regulator of Ras-like GTPase activity (Roadblock/LC7/MglB family)